MPTQISTGFNPHRRHFLQVSATAAAVAILPIESSASQSIPGKLVVSPVDVALVLDHGPVTKVWAFNETVPGPLLRYRQGDTLSLVVENQLEQPTTVHWHGLRVPIGMDGVPHLSQKPIEPGDSFHYEFKLEDAGTFWYHPHFASSQQVGMGLHGVLIVDEYEPIAVDRDVVWVLDDWRLDQDAQVLPFESNMRDTSHNGRLGNVVTVNGTIDEKFEVHPGERLRLRLVNVANARTFALNFKDLEPWVIAVDGHPVNPRRLDQSLAPLGSGQRMDLILDVTGAPGEVSSVIDQAYAPNFAYELMQLVRTSNTTSIRNTVPKRLPDNPVSRPDLERAKRISFLFEGGAMGGMTGATVEGEFKTIQELVGLGKVWSLNGIVQNDVHFDSPMFTLELDQSYIFELENRTAWEHPFHLHGHSFQVISRNGKPLAEQFTRDTVLLQPEEKAEIAFLADNPGKWMFHCHILEHQDAGMTSVIEII